MDEAQIRVLLVDDDPHACNVFQLVLDHHQMPLTIVHDAETAMAYLAKETPDIIVCDLFLPGIDGYQALRQINRSRLALGSRIVATTAYHTSDTCDEVTKYGFDGFIPKPFKTDELVLYLKEVVGQNRA